MLFCESPKNGFACGKCRACKLSKSNKRMIQSVYAADYYKKLYVKHGQFLTLTFNDKFKPDGLDHSIFSGFMKRLRRATGVRDVKFFMAGEYGGDEDYTHREHFHVLFYNHKFDMCDVEHAWSDPVTKESFGFSYDGTLTPASMKYVSGYVDKKGYDPGSGKRPPYGRSSVNIPDGMSDREIERMCLTGKVSFNGRNFAAPDLFRRRYSDQWKKYKDIRDAARESEKMKEVQEIYDRFNGDAREIAKYYDAQRQILKAKLDDRELRNAAKKAERKLKRLTRMYKRRIM